MKSYTLVFACYLTIFDLPNSASIWGQTPTPSVPEPEILSTVYYLDPVKSSLVSLEHQIATEKKLKLKRKGYAEIQFERSPVRINSDSQDFVVALTTGVNPGKFELLLMEVENGGRRSPVPLRMGEATKNSVLITIKRYHSCPKQLLS
jgi:hypothetical protein